MYSYVGFSLLRFVNHGNAKLSQRFAFFVFPRKHDAYRKSITDLTLTQLAIWLGRSSILTHKGLAVNNVECDKLAKNYLKIC